ncbi:SDR family NAD(P)-dependent oxidoreductase [Pelagibius sp.]|uniref:SDR family NAD(P)-dependent oxidoreductase n=1 Tax=Pelagibius sp. TaxID=1931238 RepID=UPI00261654F4|nr:SDR family NAD(P)-dependent oxidoreductase [Pelagibius sp.]
MAEGTGKLAGRIAVVTGASRGIGAAVAKRFAAEGSQLVLIARTVGGLEELDDEIRAAGGLQPVLVPHDLRDFDGLDRLGASLNERFGKLDILVGNAGILGPLTPVGHIPPEAWQEVMDINVTANYRLIRSLDPLLRLSDAGRAVFVTSGAASGRMAYWGPYAISKAALEALVRSYAAEITKTTVRANLLSPGPIRTGMRAAAFPGEDPMSLRTPEEICDLFLELASPACRRNGEVVQAR